MFLTYFILFPGRHALHLSLFYLRPKVFKTAKSSIITPCLLCDSSCGAWWQWWYGTWLLLQTSGSGNPAVCM